MLNGFEQQTGPLTYYERERLLPAIVCGLRHHVGESQAVTNSTIVKSLASLAYDVNAARVRKVINYIRTNDIVKCLVATSKGYYIATDAETMKEYINTLKGREDAIRAVRISMERQMAGLN